MKRILFFSLLLLSLASCHKKTHVTNYELGNPFTLKVGETQVCACGAPDVTLHSVTDSRCPEGAACFWEGEATVLLTVGSDSLRLSTANDILEFTSVDTLGNYIYTLLGVLPYPTLNGTIQQSDYEVELRVDEL